MNDVAARARVANQPVDGRSGSGHTWYVQIGLLLLSVVLLSLAFAPVNQFYLAWVGLVPWIVVISQAGSKKASFAWGFLGGWLFFMANMWWLWFVSPPGMFALTVYLAVFWGLAAVVIRALVRSPDAILNPLTSILTVFSIAVVWTASEWIRGNISFLGKQGLPWLYLGQTQTPILAMCQIADITSVVGVTFWVVLVNGMLAMLVLRVSQWRQLIPALASVAILVVGIGVYGAFRLGQDALQPGPEVLVVQSNYRQSNTGQKGAESDEIVEFHERTTREAMAQHPGVDLVVWSETMMPELNDTAQSLFDGRRVGKYEDYGEFLSQTKSRLRDLARSYQTYMLVGGRFFEAHLSLDGTSIVTDTRNSAYLLDRSGRMSEKRYDKVHLVPFGEYIPFKHTIPPLYRIFIRLGPAYYEEYALTGGEGFTVFSLDLRANSRPVRFVVPICFEDIVPSLVARMINGENGKRADLIVNITNDGWFRASQMPQHLQAAVFRSIENRVPTARSVNTGISGFIDSLGRVNNTVAAETEGWNIQTLQLDRRVAMYTRIGDTFAIGCVVLTAIVIIGLIARSRTE